MVGCGIGTDGAPAPTPRPTTTGPDPRSPQGVTVNLRLNCSFVCWKTFEPRSGGGLGQGNEQESCGETPFVHRPPRNTHQNYVSALWSSSRYTLGGVVSVARALWPICSVPPLMVLFESYCPKHHGGF